MDLYVLLTFIFLRVPLSLLFLSHYVCFCTSHFPHLHSFFLSFIDFFLFQARSNRALHGRILLLIKHLYASLRTRVLGQDVKEEISHNKVKNLYQSTETVDLWSFTFQTARRREQLYKFVYVFIRSFPSFLCVAK